MRNFWIKFISLVVVLYATYKIGFLMGDMSDDIPTYFNGQQVWDAVNDYRAQNGVQKLELDDRYCNNIGQRYYDIISGSEEGIAHAKMSEWVKENIPEGYSASEIYASGNSVEEIMEKWIGSPSHRKGILNSENNIGCSYAVGGVGIVMMGHQMKLWQ